MHDIFRCKHVPLHDSRKAMLTVKQMFPKATNSDDTLLCAINEAGWAHDHYFPIPDALFTSILFSIDIAYDEHLIRRY
jgi:hypothetical protein